MEIPRSLVMIFLMIHSLAIVGNSQGTVSVGDTLACIQKLMPCQPYLTKTPSPPTSECCVPLKQMVTGDNKCLCAVFNNQVILKNLNATLDDALHLIRSCGASDDISLCNKGAAASASIPASSSTPGSETKKNAATTICQVGMLAAILSLIVLIF